MGDNDSWDGEQNINSNADGKNPVEALLLMSVSVDDKEMESYAEQAGKIKRFLMNPLRKRLRPLTFVTDYGDAQWLIMYSNRRADGVLLEALIKAEPTNNVLIPKLVRGLLAHRKAGRWGNTRKRFHPAGACINFKAFAKVTPDFVARIWLGNAYAGEQTFKGRSVDSIF